MNAPEKIWINQSDLPKLNGDEDKAQEYCDQFKGNENEYARHITKVKVTL